MASNYLFLTGWEMGDWNYGASSLVSSPEVRTSEKRTGTYALYCDTNEGVTYALGDDFTDTLYVGVAHRPIDFGRYNRQIVTFASAGGAEITVGTAANLGGRLAIFRGDSLLYLADSASLVLNQWHYLEIACKVSNSAGVVEVKLDGVEVFNESGDTCYSAESISLVALSRSNFQNQLFANSPGYFDDFMVATDSHVGRCGIELLKPTGAGATTQLTPSAGSNYACVDEVPPTDDTDYVSGSSVDDHDTYALSDLTLSGTVKAVQGFARAKLSEAGEGSIAPVLRSGGTDYTGSDSGLDVDYVYKHWIYNTDPKTGVAWVSTNVNALEFGPKVR